MFKVNYECTFVGFYASGTIIVEIFDLSEVQFIKNYFVAETDTEEPIAYFFEINGSINWDGQIYNFDEEHMSTAVKAVILQSEYEMYLEFHQYFNVHKVRKAPSGRTIIT